MKRIHVTAAGFGVVVAGIVALVVAVSSGMATTTKPLAAGGNALGELAQENFWPGSRSERKRRAQARPGGGPG